MEQLQQAIIQLVESLPEQAILALIQNLESGAIYREVSVNRMLNVLRPHVIPAAVALRFLQAWQHKHEDCISSNIIALLIETAHKTRQRAVASFPFLELTWTGPYPPSGGRARPTLNVIREMILSAERDILVTGYVFSPSSDVVKSLVDLIVDAVLRGCNVTMALNNDGRNYHALKNLWPDYVPLPRLVHWIGRPEDPNASLHSKMVIVDFKDILITSANFTYHGLESNIETGVRIKGSPIARQMADFFFALEREKIIISY